MIAVWTHNSTSGPALFPSEQAASEFLALLDGGFLFSYAVVTLLVYYTLSNLFLQGLYVGGFLGDRYDPRIVLSIGMWFSAVAVCFQIKFCSLIIIFQTFSFGYLTEYFNVYSKTLYAFLWIASGLFQSVAWPTEVFFLFFCCLFSFYVTGMHNGKLVRS